MQEPSKIVTNRHKTVENRQKPLATGGNRKNRCEGFDNFRRCTVCVGGGALIKTFSNNLNSPLSFGRLKTFRRSHQTVSVGSPRK